ncbi:hypothetical protein ACFL34_00165 [Candidatus Sumerlaeota bacterium]
MKQPHCADRSKLGRRLEVLLFLLVLVVQLAIAARTSQAGDTGPARYSPEAVIRQAQLIDLFSGDSRGYQGLISAVYWSPLPTLLLMPFAALFRFFPPGFVHQCLGAIAAAFGAVYACAILHRELRAPRAAALLIAAAIFCLPLAGLAGWRGEWLTFGLLFALAAICHFTNYLATDGVYELILAGLWSALAVLVHPLALLLVALGALWLLPAHEHAKTDPAKRGAMLLLFLVPALYPLGVWALFNWLLLGDVVHFLRPLAGLSFAAAGHDPRLYCGLALVVVSFSCAMFAPRRQAFFWLTACTALALGMLPLLSRFETSLERRALMGRSGTAPRNNDAAESRRYLDENTVGSLVLLVGYPGYEWRGLNPSDGSFLHTMDFDPRRALARTRGRRLYVLLSRDQESLFRRRLGADWNDLLLPDRQSGYWTLHRFLRID